MQVVRIHDADRRPASWTDIIQAGQFVAFSKHVDSGAPCDARGAGFLSAAEVTCTIFDSLAEAESFCAAAVQVCPAVRFDVFDAAGRSSPAMLTVVHPSRAAILDSNPLVQTRRRAVAWALVVAGVAVMSYGYAKHTERPMVFAGFIGINLVIAGGRILLLNLGVRETEREREARLAKARER